MRELNLGSTETDLHPPVRMWDLQRTWMSYGGFTTNLGCLGMLVFSAVVQTFNTVA